MYRPTNTLSIDDAINSVRQKTTSCEKSIYAVPCPSARFKIKQEPVPKEAKINRVVPKPVKKERSSSKDASSEILLDGTPETADCMIDYMTIYYCCYYLFLFLVVVYLNPTCSVGQYLDTGKLRLLGMFRFGPGGVNHVMRSCMQSLVDCAQHNHVMNVLRAIDAAAVVIILRQTTYLSIF